MTESQAHEEQSPSIPPITPAIQEIVKKAKRALQTVITHQNEVEPVNASTPYAPQEIGEARPPPLPSQVAAAQHARWLSSLSEPQRHAYEQYKQRGLKIEERELRDLLRAAMSLHPSRDTAADVIARLRVSPERERAETGREPGPSFTSVLPDVPPEAAERTAQEVFREATERVTCLANEVSSARNRHAEQFKTLGLPELPKDSPRRKVLERAAALPRDPSGQLRSRALQPVDGRVAAMQKDIVDDPLWIAADYLDRTTELEVPEQLVRDHPDFMRAQHAYTQAEERVRKAARALNEYKPGTKLQRALDFVRGTDGDAERLRGLHAEMKAASLEINHSKRELEAVEREARAEAQELNAQSLAIQREACARRSELEQPLREAMIDRHIAERALAGEHALHHLRDAPDLGSLTYQGERTLGGFRYHEFSNFGGGTYLADATALDKTMDKLDLTAGDRVLMRTDERGARHLEVDVRGELSFDRGPFSPAPFVPKAARAHDQTVDRGR